MAFEVTQSTGRRPASTSPDLPFRRGAPDTQEALDVSNEALEWLGFTPSKGLAEDYEDVGRLGYDGRLYPALAAAVATFEDLVRGAEGKRPQGVATVYRYDGLWPLKQSRRSGGYVCSALDGGPEINEGRLALFTHKEDTGVDPILHALGLPFDPYARDRWDRGKQTQLEWLDDAGQGFEQAHPGHTAWDLSTRAVLMMVIMDRIRGEKVDDALDPTSLDYVLNRGFVRDPTLGRTKDAVGVSLVGGVRSGGGQLELGGSGGRGNPGVGVGLSAGPAKRP
ncbi:MAG TPA: hypothetical protein PKD19_00510 [Candidatus Saccharibacteria bacterium]|nr:hypothetical protein [Candidatus Saccharibacteria bacterium]HMR38259.1 hypothetical protein [Candidatus Saccharibacteria bacterium]